MGWWKRAFRPYSGAASDPRSARRDILGVDQWLERSNPRAAALLHPLGNGPAVRHTPCQHPRLSEPERGVHHPPATHPERSHPEPRLHQRQRLQNSWFPRSIPPSPHEARRVQRGPIALPARMPEPGPDWGEGSILVRMPSQGMLPVPPPQPRPLPQLEPVPVTGTGRDQAPSHDHRLQDPPAPGEDTALTTGSPREQTDAVQEWAAPPSSTKSRKRSRLACSSFVTIPPRMVGSINGAKTLGSS